MRAECEGDFDVPLDAGFAYITDPANWPDFWPDLVRIEPGCRWIAPGDEAQLVTRLLGREVALRMRLLRFEPNRLVEYESTQDGLPPARHERRFDATNDGFRYRLVVDFEPRSGLLGVFDRILVRRGVERVLRRTVANLERALPR